jgi:phosphoglycolate phosphatase-like HAD superfamily hydrolase
MSVWLFDIDGTLIASGGAGQEATFAALAEVFALPVTRAGIQFAGRTDRAIAADVFQRHGIPQTESNWQRFRESYLTQLRRQLQTRSGQVLAGVRELLARLSQSSDTHLGLLTGNIQAGAEEKLRHYALWDHFAFGGYGDYHESRDQVAQQALADAQRYLLRDVAPQEVWVIGDTVHDIRCARAIGARVIAVATGGTSADVLQAEQPDILLPSLEDVDSLWGLL